MKSQIYVLLIQSKINKDPTNISYKKREQNIIIRITDVEYNLNGISFIEEHQSGEKSK